MTSTLAHTPERVNTWRLGGRARKTVLLLHIMAAGTWFGLDVAMAVLVFTAIFTESDDVRAHTLQSLRLVTVWPMFSAAMLSLITGVILGLGSKYGLVRYWLGGDQACAQPHPQHTDRHLFTRRGGEAADLGSQLAVGADLDWNFSNMLYPPIVSPTALTVAFLLAVFKPWGRLRHNRAARGGKS